MRQMKSCGVILFRQQPSASFLVLKGEDHLDLPKGHMEAGEDEITCALRELYEETGISADMVTLEPDFRFQTLYFPRYQQFDGERVEKTVVIFLGKLNQDTHIQLREHNDYAWVPWSPPHRLNHSTIDKVLINVARYVKQNQSSSGFNLPLQAHKS